jgi:hypothetical protein
LKGCAVLNQGIGSCSRPIHSQSLKYGFLIALISSLGPLIGVLTTERWQRKHIIVLLSLLMAGSSLAFPFASNAVMIVAIGAVFTIFRAVGWVERSETHHSISTESVSCNPGPAQSLGYMPNLTKR